MYVRPQNYKYSPDIRLPENYSGNTFRELPEDNPEEIQDEVTLPLIENAPQEAEAVPTSAPHKESFGLRLGSLFKGIGSEELLILALILLLADSESNDEIILFLAILLFVK